MGGPLRFAAALVLVGGGTACGDSEPPGSGTADGAMPDGGLVTPPDIPWLAEGVPPIAPPALTPCPDGWREVDDDTGLTKCDPYPEEAPLACPEGEAHFPGEPGCVPVGSPCPAGDFADGLPADATVVYVQPGGSGDGMSPTSPYGSLTSFAFGGLARGTVIALSRGTHQGPVMLLRGVVLRGACAGATVVTASVASEADGVITMRNAQGEARDLTVADSPRPGVVVDGSSAEAVLEGVVVSGTETAGVLLLDGARLTARTMVVTDTRSRGRDGAFGRGLSVEPGSSATVWRALFERNRDLGVYASGERTSVTLSDVAVRDTLGRQSDATGGSGLAVRNGATAEVNRALLSGSGSSGLYVGGEGTSVTVSDVVVRHTLGQESDGADGRGLNVHSGATAEASHLLLERNRAAGVFAGDEGTSVMLSDVVVRDTLEQASDGTIGRGLNVQEGATAALTRGMVSGNRSVGVFADGALVSVTLYDVTVRGTLGRTSDGNAGTGLRVGDGAAAEMSRALLSTNRNVGILVAGPGASVTLSDVAVHDTLSQASDQTGGRGIAVQEGAAADGSRVLISRSREVGVYAGDPGTSVTLSDVAVRDTQSGERSGAGGRGVDVERGASLDLSRALVSENRDVGVLAAGEGTWVTLSEVAVHETHSRERDGISGHGVGSYLRAALSMSRFAIARSELCGVHIALGGELDLSVGEVRESLIGACVQVDDYDLSRLQTSVRYVDNESNLQATDLPVPSSATSVPDVP